ncbi:hypothetical protein [Tomitella fengzijianii]|uniref:Secreted protein n=1 Tax=Tomitella fengzijianii TaxID=2597660 RepID=A0A516X0U8_9ACTN|nr:hypothetical protein [Tomitella fengzijianii]QDQ96716.1 hypothetical protein FO059_04370 [Tomitella fengzijianii]
MKTQTMRRVLGAATAVGASVALIGTGLAGAAPSSDLSSDSGGSAGSGGSSTMSASADLGTPFTFDNFADCPKDTVTAPIKPGGPNNVGSCYDLYVRSGTMKLGNLTVDIPDGSLKIAVGQNYKIDENGNPIPLDPGPGYELAWHSKDDGHNGLYSNDVTVPGGAFGTSSSENFALTGIKAEVQAVKPPVVHLLESRLTMSIRLKLSNPLLGDSCYLGSAENPINIDLKPTYVPPALENDHGDGAMLIGLKSEDNSFSVPGATGCGLFGSLNGIVNSKAGAPSASGQNSLTTVSDVYNISSLLPAWPPVPITTP